MRRTLALAVLLVLAILPVLSATEAWARAGGGRSSGSRGTRSYSAPARPPSSPASPSQQPSSPAVSPVQSPRSGWGGMMGGMLGGLLLGGLLGGLLSGGGFGSGIGMMEILIIAGLAWFAFSYMRRRHAAASPAYAMASGPGSGPATRDDAVASARYGATAPASTATLEPPPAPPDLERGLGHVRQMDASFDPRAFAETASDVFFKVQGAWTARDLRSVSGSLAPEIQDQLQRDCNRLRAEQKINRLENIAVRTAEVTEAWQEGGQDYVTVHFLASLLDYTTDESGARVLEGSRTEPVKFEEYWTFTRPVGPGPFKLSAIQQA
ncbi:MAG: Tim44 domain-containing protein [Candidatus Rokuibacteriota bacterium]